MTNPRIPSIDRYKDVSSFNNYAMFKKLHIPEKITMKFCMYASRDNARTPMQWDDSKNAGFTSADETWFEINPNYTEINVQSEIENKNSILNYYKKLLRFRKENDIVKYGDFHTVKTKGKIFAYMRKFNNERMLVVCSFSDKALKFKSPSDFDLAKAELVLFNYNDNKISDNGFTTRPYETRVYIIK
jgi:glycosidase